MLALVYIPPTIVDMILPASPLIISAFWIGTMFRRKVDLREWFLFVAFWAIVLVVAMH